MPSLVLPKWAPKEKTVPLTEEHTLFHQEVTRYHDRVEGALHQYPNNSPTCPNPLESFPNNIQIVVGAAELIAYLSDVRALYVEAQCKHTDRLRHRVPFPRSAADPEARDPNRRVLPQGPNLPRRVRPFHRTLLVSFPTMSRSSGRSSCALTRLPPGSVSNWNWLTTPMTSRNTS
jgi:hypothetical protein